jgi:outer membrane protein, heavy metal efflux system
VIAAAVLLALPVFARLSPRDAQTRAVAYDTDVRAAVATEREREATLRAARVAAMPHVIGDYSLAPQAGPNDIATVEQRLFTVGAGINVTELFSARSNVRVAAADLLASQRDVESTALTAERGALKLYFTALQNIALEALQIRSVSDAARDLAVARIRVRAGDAPQLDATRAAVALAQAQAASYRAQADRANAVDALASATRVPATSLTSLAEPPEGAQPTPSIDRAVARALADRPELDSLLRSMQARDAAVAVAQRSSYPTATLQAGYATGIDTGIHVGGPQVAAHLDIPVVSGASAEVVAARARADAAHAALDAERRQIVLDVTAAIRDASAEDLAAGAADRARTQAERVLVGVELGYREGASSGVDVADARRTYLQASVDALTARYQQAEAHWYVGLVAP